MLALRMDEAKGAFFDRAKVVQALGEAERRVFSRFGAFVRQRARTSIRSRRAISRPGQPPSSHVGTLRQLILFAYDARRRSVVIGPVPFRQGEAPKLLEYGGQIQRGGRTLTYRPRPFMGPAFQSELVRLPSLWRGSVR